MKLETGTTIELRDTERQRAFILSKTGVHLFNQLQNFMKSAQWAVKARLKLSKNLVHCTHMRPMIGWQLARVG